MLAAPPPPPPRPSPPGRGSLAPARAPRFVYNQVTRDLMCGPRSAPLSPPGGQEDLVVMAAAAVMAAAVLQPRGVSLGVHAWLTPLTSKLTRDKNI
ncbi:unnamed protein product [Merluccius merluccius]